MVNIQQVDISSNDFWYLGLQVVHGTALAAEMI